MGDILFETHPLIVGITKGNILFETSIYTKLTTTDHLKPFHM
jgi:hypothetical protein